MGALRRVDGLRGYQSHPISGKLHCLFPGIQKEAPSSGVGASDTLNPVHLRPVSPPTSSVLQRVTEVQLRTPDTCYIGSETVWGREIVQGTKFNPHLKHPNSQLTRPATEKGGWEGMGNRALAGTSGRKKGQGWWEIVVGNQKKTGKKKKNDKGKAIGGKEPEHGKEKSKK